MQYAPKIIAQHMDKPFKKTIRGNKKIIASNLNIMQFNCATLCKLEQINLFEEQMILLKTHIACFQETHSRTTEVMLTKHKKHYIQISAKSESTSCGIEIWIAAILPFGTINGEDIFINKNQVLVLQSDERLLIVRIFSPIINIIIVSFHAQSSANPEDSPSANDKQMKWLDDFQKSINKWKHLDIPILINGDLNENIYSHTQSIKLDKKLKTHGLKNGGKDLIYQTGYLSLLPSFKQIRNQKTQYQLISLKQDAIKDNSKQKII